MTIYQLLVDKIINSKVNKLCILTQKIIMIISTVIMLSLLASVVFCRYIFYTDIYGYDEFLLCSAFWMYFMGAVYSMQEGTHVRADIVGMFLKPIPRLKLKIVANVVQIIVSIVISIFAFNLVARSIKTWQISAVWEIPFLLYQLPIFIGFFLMTLYMILELFVDISSLKVIKNANYQEDN
ncbi:MAG: TRAP transporter small permease subunit [Sphaerochaetaceae bacterium]|mgnify:FL=1|nr:TRAP transporter small permease subunit [Sphaerochaetaceae bacterium]